MRIALSSLVNSEPLCISYRPLDGLAIRVFPSACTCALPVNVLLPKRSRANSLRHMGICSRSSHVVHDYVLCCSLKPKPKFKNYAMPVYASISSMRMNMSTCIRCFGPCSSNSLVIRVYPSCVQPSGNHWTCPLRARWRWPLVCHGHSFRSQTSRF